MVYSTSGMLSHHFLDASIHSAACWTLVVSAMCDFRKHCQSRLLSSTVGSLLFLLTSYTGPMCGEIQKGCREAKPVTKPGNSVERDLCWGWWFVTLYINGYVRWASNSGFSKGHGLFESPGNIGGVSCLGWKIPMQKMVFSAASWQLPWCG